MISERLPDWETRFVAYMGTAADRVRSGGEQFCALFACGAVEAITGANPADEYKGRYRQVANDLEATFDRHFNERPAALAQRGDLAWHDGSVGVVMGGDAVFVGEQPVGTPALVNVPRAAWSKVWGVGHG